MAVEAFGVEKEFLYELLRQVGERDSRRLPDFRRGWVWPHSASPACSFRSS